MQEWITAVIGVGGTLSGAGLGYAGAVRISRRERESTMKGQIQAAVAVYLGALYESVGELRDLPPNKPPNAIDRAVRRLQGEQGAWLAQRRAEYRLTGDRYRQLAGRLATAAAQLQVLPLSPELDAAVVAATDYAAKLSEQRTPELRAKWPEVRAAVLAAVEALDGS